MCGEALINISRLPVCPRCLEAIHRIAGGVCSVCGERLFSSLTTAPLDAGPARCGLCRRVEPPFVRAAAYGSYDGGLRELIHLLKYASVRPAAAVLGRMLEEAIAGLEGDFSDNVIAVVPVPLHRVKLRQRQFNHAELIARAAIRISEQSARFQLCSGILERRRETSSQTGLTSHQRRENVRGAFDVPKPELVRGREVLVLDDVYTTGATVSECARVLRRAGATRVWVATVARTLKAQAQYAELQPAADAAENDEKHGRPFAARAVG